MSEDKMKQDSAISCSLFCLRLAFLLTSPNASISTDIIHVSEKLFSSVLVWIFTVKCFWKKAKSFSFRHTMQI